MQEKKYYSVCRKACEGYTQCTIQYHETYEEALASKTRLEEHNRSIDSPFEFYVSFGYKKKNKK